MHAGGAAGFAEVATDWVLPSAYVDYGNVTAVPFGEWLDTVNCGPSQAWSHFPADLDGEGRDDLVVPLDDCSAEWGIGSSIWQVYPAGVDGFADAAVPWELPTRYEAYDMGTGRAMDTPKQFADVGMCDSWARMWAYDLADLTGDGAVDLVVTQDECATPGVGTTHWNVHPAVCPER